MLQLHLGVHHRQPGAAPSPRAVRLRWGQPGRGRGRGHRPQGRGRAAALLLLLDTALGAEEGGVSEERLEVVIICLLHKELKTSNILRMLFVYFYEKKFWFQVKQILILTSWTNFCKQY